MSLKVSDKIKQFEEKFIESHKDQFVKKKDVATLYDKYHSFHIGAIDGHYHIHHE